LPGNECSFVPAVLTLRLLLESMIGEMWKGCMLKSIDENNRKPTGKLILIQFSPYQIGYFFGSQIDGDDFTRTVNEKIAGIIVYPKIINGFFICSVLGPVKRFRFNNLFPCLDIGRT
jgi:hypothetical protein